MKKILVIENNLEVRENTMEILSLANYDVVSAESGKRGVDVAQHERPDLIICDIVMPELDGYGVLHILNKNEETAGIPFIFLSANAERCDVQKGMNSGADDYLTKPFDDTDLLNAIAARLKKFEVREKQYDLTPEGLDNLICDARHTLNMKNVGKDTKVKTFEKESEIFSKGDLPLNIFFVKSGIIKTFKSNQDKKELILNFYTANEFFGYEAILKNVNYCESAVAMQDSELIVIPRYDFMLLILNGPDISRSFINLLGKKVAEQEEQLLRLAYNSIRQRTAKALLKSEMMKDVNSNIPLSGEGLAEIVGTASESISRVLSEFKDERIIEIESGVIKIMSTSKLEKIMLWSVF